MVTLYDLTNTYFEVESLGNDNAALGHSKEKRTDPSWYETKLEGRRHMGYKGYEAPYLALQI